MHGSAPGAGRWGPSAAAAALALLVVALYMPVRDHDFVAFDDPLYVTGNARLREGLSAENVRWAFVTERAHIWHPLTWLSYLVDAELHGVERAGPWLATNVALHALDAALFLWALGALTAPIAGPGTRWACLFAVGVFALHPVQVESVAWVSARKEVLAGGFVALTLVAYARYARAPTPARYAVVMAASALGAMAKSSHVALPFLLLLLDVWPLGRLGGAAGGGPSAARLGRLAAEKLPLLAIQLAAVAVNAAMVSRAPNVWAVDPPLATRIAAVLVNEVGTLERLLWPVHLAIVYPNPLQAGVAPPGIASVACAAAILLGVTVLAALGGPARRPFLVGWLGFLALLAPMSGLVPMGLRSPHDRYLYVPLLVLAFGLSFGVRALVASSRSRRVALAVVAALLLVACAVQTRRQIAVWRDSDALFEHALAVTRDNALAHWAFGTALGRRGEQERGIAQLEAALAIHADLPDAQHNLGWLRFRRGDTEAALSHLQRAVALRPDWALALVHLGEVQLWAEDEAGALATLERAVAVAPGSAEARAQLGLALLGADRRDEAERALREALALDPDHAGARRALAWLEALRAR